MRVLARSARHRLNRVSPGYLQSINANAQHIVDADSERCGLTELINCSPAVDDCIIDRGLGIGLVIRPPYQEAWINDPSSG